MDVAILIITWQTISMQFNTSLCKLQTIIYLFVFTNYGFRRFNIINPYAAFFKGNKCSTIKVGPVYQLKDYKIAVLIIKGNKFSACPISCKLKQTEPDFAFNFSLVWVTFYGKNVWWWCPTFHANWSWHKGALIRPLNYCEGADIRLLNSDRGAVLRPYRFYGGHLSATFKIRGTSLGGMHN